MNAEHVLQVTVTEEDKMITTLLDRAKELAKNSRSPNTLGAGVLGGLGTLLHVV